MAVNIGQGGVAGGFQQEFSHHFNAFGVNWTPANAPVGTTITGWSYSVIVNAADNQIIDSDGTVLTNLPSGYSASGGTLGGGSISPPQQINPGTNPGRILVQFQVK